MSKQNLPRLVELYFQTKNYFIRAEETDPSFKSFIQPQNELTKAFDHFMRAKAQELGLRSPVAADPTTPEQYIDFQYGKALGHIYRAFFDVADWLAMNIREDLVEQIRGFSTTSISAVFPEYYATIKPRIETVSTEIAALRDAKDVAIATVTIEEVSKYAAILEELLGFKAICNQKIAALHEFQGRLEGERRADRTWSSKQALVFAMVSAIVGFIIAFGYAKVFPDKTVAGVTTQPTPAGPSTGFVDGQSKP